MNGSLICRICGAAGRGRTYSVRETMFRLGETFTYFQCDACGCLQIADMPHDMARYYPANYYSFSSTSRDAASRNPLIRRVRAIRGYCAVIGSGTGSRILRALMPHPKLSSLAPLNLTRQSRILDIGCGLGWRLYALREAGFRNLLGADPYIEADILHDNGLRIEKKHITETGGTWDVVMFHHSFEHVPDPLAHLKAAASLLLTGGYCLIRIPTVTSYAWEHYREHWYQVDAPRHFYLHSVQSVGLLAEQAGFRVDEIRYDSTLDQFWKSELNKHADDPVPPVIDRKQKRVWKHEAERLNRERRGDQAAFYLIKR